MSAIIDIGIKGCPFWTEYDTPDPFGCCIEYLESSNKTPVKVSDPEDPYDDYVCPVCKREWSWDRKERKWVNIESARLARKHP